MRPATAAVRDCRQSGRRYLQPVAADTSGTYTQLVKRANALYNQGSVSPGREVRSGVRVFLAASKVYAGAWEKQATEPSVGTDLATSLFYSGKSTRLWRSRQGPRAAQEFQTAALNKGNYLAQKASDDDKAGNVTAAKAAYAGARVAYQKAIDLDPKSSSGQQAQQQLGALPSPSP